MQAAVFEKPVLKNTRFRIRKEVALKNDQFQVYKGCKGAPRLLLGLQNALVRHGLLTMRIQDCGTYWRPPIHRRLTLSVYHVHVSYPCIFLVAHLKGLRRRPQFFGRASGCRERQRPAPLCITAHVLAPVELRGAMLWACKVPRAALLQQMAFYLAELRGTTETTISFFFFLFALLSAGVVSVSHRPPSSLRSGSHGGTTTAAPGGVPFVIATDDAAACVCLRVSVSISSHASSDRQKPRAAPTSTTQPKSTGTTAVAVRQQPVHFKLLVLREAPTVL